MKFNSDFKYDLEVGQVEEKMLAQILSGSTIEVKRDFLAHRTGNVLVEYESRGKPSGIATTQAKHWAFILENETVVIIRTDRLKDKCRAEFQSGRIASGGDSDTSKGVLLPVSYLST